RRHLPEAVGVRLGEVAGGHQVTVDPRRPGFGRPRAEAGRPASEREDEGDDDRAEDQRNQGGLRVRTHHVKHRSSTRKLPCPRLFGKLDTLEKPGERIKQKRREVPPPPARFDNLWVPSSSAFASRSSWLPCWRSRSSFSSSRPRRGSSSTSSTG